MTAPSTDTPIDIQALQALLQGDTFAPWVRELALRVEQATPTEVVLALPIAPIHVHGGGVLCGQTVMAAADTAMVLAVSSALGGFKPMTTVQLSTTFQRPVLGKDVLVTSRLTKLGRSLAFADITMTAGEAVVAQATTVYAIG